MILMLKGVKITKKEMLRHCSGVEITFFTLYE